MRKLILISAFAAASFSASFSAQAGDRSLILAANDTPAATTAPATTTAPAEAKPDTASTAKQDSTKQASKPHGKRYARHTYEGDEAKARRIAAKYGVYW